MNTNLKSIYHKVDLCVVGGGLAGMCAAVAAARHGIKVALMHDRPVYGGNASSEIRMWVCGAHGKNNRETGIIEEIALETLYRNPYRRYPMWDAILFELINNEKNITPILNCSCNDIEMDGSKIKKVIGWQTTTQCYHIIEAKLFADCSGDSILAPLSGAEYRWGRESQNEFGESIAPEQADKKTMGLSCLIQARETDKKHTFIAPSWARKFTKEDLPYRLPDMNDPEENFWYMELGGEGDTIHDTEKLRDELISVAYGIWDFVKNSGEYNADNWELEFVGFLPGKRESRRYVGDYIMNQNDVRDGGHFDDIAAYGGWTMDDHNPAGINTKDKPNIFHPAPSPFGIPYRCLYSVNIENLYFAGRNISVTHTAMSASRVMATCALLGQAVGTASAIAIKNDATPREISEKYDLQVLRFFMLSAHYRSPLNFSAELMEAAKNGLERITTAAENLKFLINNARTEDMSEDERKKLAGSIAYVENFEKAMDDDFNTADAISAVFELVKYMNTTTDGASSKEYQQNLFDCLIRLTDVLGIIVDKEDEILASDIEALIEERQAARKAKNFARADEIRDELLAKGIILKDTREGVQWKKA